jgi:hypothetical protein
MTDIVSSGAAITFIVVLSIAAIATAVVIVGASWCDPEAANHYD